MLTATAESVNSTSTNPTHYALSHTVTEAKLRELLSNPMNRECVLRLLFADMPAVEFVEDSYGRTVKHNNDYRFPVELLPEILKNVEHGRGWYTVYLDYDNPRFAIMRPRAAGEVVFNLRDTRTFENMMSEAWEVDTDGMEKLATFLVDKLRRRGRRVIDENVYAGDPEWKKVKAPNEATNEIEALVFAVKDSGIEDPEGDFLASTPTNGAMGEQYPAGVAIVFEADAEPQEGAIVLADVTVKRKDGSAYRKVIRRYTSNAATGAITLVPEDKAFASFTEGVKKGEVVTVEVLGVATPYKVTWNEARTVGHKAICRVG